MPERHHFHNRMPAKRSLRQIKQEINPCLKDSTCILSIAFQAINSIDELFAAGRHFVPTYGYANQAFQAINAMIGTNFQFLFFNL